MCQLWSASHWCQAWCYLIVRRYAKLFLFFFFTFFFWSEDLEESWVFFGGSARWNWRIYLGSKCGDQRYPEETEVRGLSITVPKGGGGLRVPSLAGTVPLRSCRPVGGPTRSRARTFLAAWKRTVGLDFWLYTGFIWRHQGRPRRSFFLSLSSFPKH